MSLSLPRVVSSGVLVLFLALPFIALLSFVGEIHWALDSEVISVFGFSFSQALASAALSLVWGTLGALGLTFHSNLSYGRKTLSWVEGLILLPNAVPVLLLLLSVLKFFPWSRGWVGIVFTHALLNSGLVAVAVAQLFREKISAQAELAWVEGASGFRFFWRGVLPQLRQDFMLIFLFVFAICFTSFAIPLVLGGSRATTVEVLIYQMIRLSGDWSEALGLATLQILAIASLAWFLRKRASPTIQARRVRVPLLSWRWGLSFALIPSFILIFGLFEGSLNGFKRLMAIEPLLLELPSLFLGSAIVGFSTGILVSAFLFLIAFADPRGWLRRVMLGYAAPSSVLIGFGLLILWRETGWASYLKIALGLTLITVPSFYRWQWDSILLALESQRQTARILGASEFLIFRKIVFPQAVRPLGSIAGLAALWAWGDFALSSVVAERSMTLAMVVRGLMESYRLDAATALVWSLVLGGLISFAIFSGVGRVFGAKPQT